MKHTGNIKTGEHKKEYLESLTEIDGHLIVDSKVNMPALTSVGGYVSINSNAKFDAPALTSIGGDVYIYSKFDAPALTSIGGHVSIHSKLDAPALTSIGGDVYISSDAKLDAPALTSVGGYVSIHSKLDAPALTSVGGYVSIHSKLDAPALTSVGGGVSIYSNSKFDAPALTSVGGYVSINSNAKFDAPALTSIGGDVYIYSKFDAPALTSIGGDVSINSDAKFDAPALKNKNCKTTADNVVNLRREISTKVRNSFFALGILFADGIAAKIVSKKEIGENTIYTCTVNAGMKIIYVAQNGEKFSHGETVEKAIEDLRYKISDRDTTKFKSWNIDDEKSLDELIQAYRVITGACGEGTKLFVESQKELPEKMKIKTAIRMTKGKFGHEEFAGFFK